jgi:tripartite-type tricarboxylate transporter receptor subunit TctC
MGSSGRSRLAVAALAVLTAAAVPGARAAYPDRPIRMVVPSPAGGGTDTAMRMMAPRLGERLGQQIVLDNRGGAAGNIGGDIVARAAPDGYTLLAMIASHTINPSIMKRVPFDIERDFAPVSLTVTLPNVLVSNPALPAQTLKDLIGYIRARPGQVQFASAGIGSNPHLMMELFMSMTGLKMIHVPYKGAAPAFVDVMGGHVPVMAGNILNALPHIRAGRVRAYGVTSARRSAAAPEIPTIAESGVPGYDAVQWFGVLAPAKTPDAIVTRLHSAIVVVLQEPELRKRYVDDGADPAPSASPQEFAALIRAEVKKWAAVVKAAGIQPE